MSTQEKEKGDLKTKRNSKEKLKTMPIPKNPLLEKHTKFLSKIPKDVKENFFSPEVSHEVRASILQQSCEEGESLVNSYSWAIPDSRCLRIMNNFSPIIEVGAGKNAYWSKYMFEYGIDITAYDIDLEEGGQITHSSENVKKKHKTESSTTSKFQIQQGGPDVLTSEESAKRTLFLCYPDEKYEDDGSSLGISCLSNYQGKYVIHVGELYGSHTLSIDQAPYGRSTSCEFQDCLNTYFHCLLNVRIPNWIHVNDTLSVWKRSELCTVLYEDDEGDDKKADNEDVKKDDDEDVEEDIAEYKFIPVDERLPVDIAAPCVRHLLQYDAVDTKEREESNSSKSKK